MVQSATEVIQFDTATPLSGNPRGPVPNRCVAVRNCNATVQARSAAVDDRNEPARDSTTTALRRNGQQKKPHRCGSEGFAKRWIRRASCGLLLRRPRSLHESRSE